MGFKKFLDKELQKSRDAEMRKEKEKHAAETRLTMEKFEEMFGKQDGVFVDGSIVKVDGVELVLVADLTWAVIGECPKCNDIVLSNPCKTVEDVAREVNKFVPGWQHTRYCHS